MYKIMILLNTFSSEIGRPISTKFHFDPTVETGLRLFKWSRSIDFHAHIWLNNDNKITYSSSKPRTAQMIILSLVAMTGLEKCCITSAYLQ